MAGLSAKPLTILTASLIWVLAIILSIPDALFSHVPTIVLKGNHTILICSPFPDEFGNNKYSSTVIIIIIYHYYRYFYYYPVENIFVKISKLLRNFQETIRNLSRTSHFSEKIRVISEYNNPYLIYKYLIFQADT